jgi:tetratricopeptide (TPR) repeat protein
MLREAVRLDPLSLPANHMLAHAFYALRQYDAAIRQCATTIDLEPTYARAHALLALALALTGSHRDAVLEADQAVKLTDREYFVANWATSAATFALAGQQNRAKALLHEITARSKKEVTSAYWPALAHASMGEASDAMRLLESALRAREPWLVSLVYEPLADPLRSRKDFRSLIAGFGLPPRE